MRPLRRRDLLALPVLLAGSAAAIKLGGRWLVGVSEPVRAPSVPLHHLSARQAATLTAAALAVAGPAAEAAYRAGTFDPVATAEGWLAGVAPDQAKTLALTLTILEEWTLGLRGFSSRTRDEQRSQLARWRNSDLTLKRQVWGVVHVFGTASFAGTEAGWAAMDYPGPCVGTGRVPGQTAPFEWDPVVP